MFSNLGNKLAKIKESWLGRPATAGYHAYQNATSWGTQFRKLPLLTFYRIEEMIGDSMVILGLAMREAPIADAELAYKKDDEYVYGIKADNEEVGQYVIKQIERFWANDLHKVLQDQVYGWMAGEVLYRLVDGEIEYDTILDRHARDVRALESNGAFWGTRFTQVNGSGAVDLPAGKSFWHGFRARNGSYYGHTILRGAYPSWCDKNLDGGAIDVRKLYMHRDAYGGPVMGYPKGSMEIEGKGTIAHSDIARQMIEQYKAGAAMTKPNSYDAHGNNDWTIEWRETGPVPTHIFDFVKDLDREILRGLEVPDEILMSGGAGSWEGKKVPLTAFYTQENIWASSILSAFDKQVLRPLVLLRFGKAYDFDAQLKPFSVQLAENENEGDGKKDESPSPGFGMQWGQPGMPQQRPQQPTALSLDHAADLYAAEVTGQAERIVGLAEAAIRRREAV